MEKADVHEVVLVGGSTRIPKVQQLLQEFFDGRELKKSVNLDEVVAYGAALLAANLTGQSSATMQDLMLLEVTPLSLGLEDPDGTMTTVIKRNTPIPTKQICGRETASDYQTVVTFRIFEGERARTRDNYLLGSCRLTGIVPVPRGETKFDVAFEIDENGILHVSVVERSTEKQNCITITNYRGRLSEKEIEQMLRDAERYKQEDEEERRRMAAMNALLDYIYSIKRKLEREELKQKTSEEYRKGMLAMCEETIKWTETKTQATKEDYKEMLRKFENECSLIVGMANPGL
ncbi:Heat shock cognate 70 kDa protein [Taenia solium]|eukprot:TsM_001076600 transcript=TsM_001076600 gene=TsM_001076600